MLNQTIKPHNQVENFPNTKQQLITHWEYDGKFPMILLNVFSPRLIFYVYQNVCKSMEAQHFITTLNGNAYKKHIIIY